MVKKTNYYLQPLMILCANDFKGNYSSVGEMGTMQRQKRAGVFLFTALLLLSSWAGVLVSANGHTGSINTFAGGFSNAVVSLQGSTIDNSTVIEIPRNVTFESASFLVKAEAGETTPGSVWLDIDQDGSHEWAFTGAGYGDLAHQNAFNDSSLYNSIATTATYGAKNWHASNPILLPHAATLSTADLNMSYSPQIGGGMLQLGHLDDMVIGDFDNDSNDDIALLSTSNNTTGSNTSISLVSWNLSSGMTNTTWITTCDNATYADVADLNNDGLDDVATFSLSDDLACIHITNSTSGIPGAKLEVNLMANTRDAGFADFTSDGFADLVSIHPNGKLSLRKYSNKTSSFANNATATINAENSPNAANLSHLFLDSPYQGANISAIVIDNTGYGVEVIWLNNQIDVTTNDFDGMGLNIISGDIDNDGDMDFVSERTTGGSTVTKYSQGSWDSDNSNNIVNLVNATIGDHDGDGNNTLIMPSPGVSDGNQSTVEGQLDYRNFYYHNSGSWQNRGWRINSSDSYSSTQPWSRPQNIIMGDMDGDGLEEQIIIAGEGSLTGLYVSAWHTIEIDIDNDGNADLEATGYAGDGVLGQAPLAIEDPFGEMYSILSPQMSAGGYTTDGYGISMSQYSFNFSANSNGSFNLSQLDFGYDIDFRVDINPHSSGNLTNVFNQRQTGGVGIIDVALAFNSTKAGNFTLTGLAAEHIAGAPNLALPPTPILVVDQLASDRVVLNWQDSFEFGLDLVQFEVFRVTSGDAIDLNTVYSVTPLNISIDSTIDYGASYDYAVRSLHTYGVTSNLSATVSVTIPYPAPPANISGVTAQDTEDDGGGSLDISWSQGDASITLYEVYISTANITNYSSLSGQTFSASFTPDVLSATLSCCASGSSLIDGTAYWVSVIGLDALGNTTAEIQSYGPVYTRNDTLRSANLVWDVSASTHQQQMHLDASGPLHVNLTLMTEGQPVVGEQLWFNIEHPSYSNNFTGISDENGVWQAVSVNQLSELSNAVFSMVGDVEFSAGYAGSSDNILLQPISNASLNQTIGAKVHSIITANSTAQINQDSSFSTTIEVDSATVEQQYFLEGIQYAWEITTIEGDMASSGTEEVKGGEFTIDGFTVENTILRVWSLNTSDWLDYSSDNFTISFLPWVDDSVEENNSSNETDNETQPWQPTTISSVLLNCPVQDYAWQQNATDLDLVCEVTNNNPFEVSAAILLGDQVAIEFWSNTATTYQIAANDSTEMTLSVVRNGPSTGLFAGMMGVSWTITTTATEWNLETTDNGEFNWNLEAEIVDNSGSDTNNTTPVKTESNTALYFGIGAFVILAIVAIAVIALRPKDDDFDFEDDDDGTEEGAVPQSTQASKPVVAKTNKTLEELKAEGTTIGEDAPDARPSSQLFNEVDGDSNYHTEAEQYEHDDQSQQSGDGITTDENGTEWYEDEVGVWWYREQGWEDWAEWQN